MQDFSNFSRPKNTAWHDSVFSLEKEIIPWRKVEKTEKNTVTKNVVVRKSKNPRKSSREYFPVDFSKNSTCETEIDARQKLNLFPREIKNIFFMPVQPIFLPMKKTKNM